MREVRKGLFFWACALVAFFFAGSDGTFLQADDSSEKKGYEISKGNYMNIPSDMKVRKIANNVITPETDADYTARRLDDQKRETEELRQRVQDLEKRVKILESRR